MCVPQAQARFFKLNFLRRIVCRHEGKDGDGAADPSGARPLIARRISESTRAIGGEKKNGMTPAGKAKNAAAMKARWAAKKAAAVSAQ